MYSADDYRNAPSGNGPLAGQWADKPHRFAYDMARLLEVLGDRLEALRKQRRDRPTMGLGYYESFYEEGKDAARDAEIEFLEEVLAPSEQKEFEGYA